MVVALLALQLFSLSFNEGASMPGWTAHGAARCPGGDRSPELHWGAVPAGTRSLALTLFDPDARAGAGFFHWIVYDLPPSTRHLPAGVMLPTRELGMNSFGEQTYGGPCPPLGPAHHYVFTLYALDVATVHAASPLDGASLLDRMRGHVLASARIVGRYGVKY